MWIQVIGLESFQTLTDEVVMSHIKKHVFGLRTMDRRAFAGAKLVVITESNFSALFAERVASFLGKNPDTFGPVECIYQPVKRNGVMAKRYGVVTTHAKKEAYVIQTVDALTMDRLMFAQQGVCADGPNAWHRNKDKLIRQMAAYRSEIKVPTDQTHGTFRQSFTGKGGNQKDDLAMAFQINLYHTRELLRDPQFLRRCGTRFMAQRPGDL